MWHIHNFSSGYRERVKVMAPNSSFTDYGRLGALPCIYYKNTYFKVLKKASAVFWSVNMDLFKEKKASFCHQPGPFPCQTLQITSAWKRFRTCIEECSQGCWCRSQEHKPCLLGFVEKTYTIKALEGKGMHEGFEEILLKATGITKTVRKAFHRLSGNALWVTGGVPWELGEAAGSW